MSYSDWTATSTTYRRYETASTACATVFAPAADESTDVVAPVLKEWTSRRGETRHYIQNVPAIIGLETTAYNTGWTRWATLAGRDISNAESSRIARACRDMSLYLDATGKLRWYVNKWAPNAITLDEVVKAVRTSIDTHK